MKTSEKWIAAVGASLVGAVIVTLVAGMEGPTPYLVSTSHGSSTESASAASSASEATESTNGQTDGPIDQVATVVEEQTLSAETWQACVEALLDADRKRQEAVSRASRRLWDAAAELCRHADCDRFVNETVSLESHGSWTYDAARWRRWILEQYQTELFSLASLAEAVFLEAELLHGNLNQIDAEALVAMECDAELPATEFSRDAIDLSDVARYAEYEEEQVLEAVKKANNAQTASTGLGFAAGLAAEQAARNYSADSNGEVTWSQAIGGLLVGMAADAVTSEAASSLAGVRPEVLREVRGSVGRWGEVLGPGGMLSESILLQFAVTRDEQESRLLEAVFDTIGLDQDEATRLYREAKSASRAASRQ